MAKWVVFPEIWSFEVSMVLRDRPHRIPVTIDMVDYAITLPGWVVLEMSDRVNGFVMALGDVVANQYAFLKWQGTSGVSIEYQFFALFPDYAIQSGTARFPFAVSTGSAIYIEEISSSVEIVINEMS